MRADASRSATSERSGQKRAIGRATLPIYTDVATADQHKPFAYGGGEGGPEFRLKRYMLEKEGNCVYDAYLASERSALA